MKKRGRRGCVTCLMGERRYIDEVRRKGGKGVEMKKVRSEEVKRRVEEGMKSRRITSLVGERRYFDEVRRRKEM